MPNKFELITKAYSDECADVIRSPQNWCEFLSSACYNYRLRFDEQLLIFIQRPDATAVLEFEKWNKRFNRKINRNAKGIAVFADVERTKIKHYFDISDTSENELSRPVPIWKYKDEYENDVIETFENIFGALSNKNDIVDAVMSAADNAVEDNTIDYIAELPSIKNDSFLEELDDDSISTIYRRAIKNSVAFMVLTRLGINANEYFSREDFEGVVNFNTTETLNALGYATSDITEIALNEVSKTVLSLEKSNRIIAKSEKAEYIKAENKNIERSVSNDTNHLQKTGRSADTELGTSGTEEFDIEQIWSVEEKVSQGGASSAVLQPVDNGQARQPSARGGRESEINGRIIDEENVSSGGLDRGAESNRPNDLGSGNEQPETEDAGNRDERGNLRSVTDELPPFLDNDLIMGVLENSDDDLVHKKSFIVEKFKELSESERIPYTQTLYGGRFTEYNINNTIVGLKAEKDGLLMYEGTYKSRTKESGFSWGVVAELIGQLIYSGKYLPKEKKEQEQEQSAQIGLFDYVADIPEEQYVDESNQVSLLTDFGVSQQIIDEALCIGANDTDSTLDIAMFFRRDRGTEYNTEFLKKHYKTNGAGFYFNNEQVSVWYNENGFNVAKGTTAQKPSATHLTWEQVAKRIRELLDMGRYIPQEKLDMIDDRELSIVSDRIISFVRDMDDEESSEYLPRGKKIVDNVLGYPDEVAALKEYLSDGNNSVALFREYSKFAKAYENGMINLYKYNYEYSVPYVYEIFKGMQIEPTNFKTADDFNPNRQYFISNDEIDNFLRRGKSSAESRFRIYTGFANSNDKSERVKFIKDYYGLSGSYSGNDNLDSSPKGLTISHGNIMEPYAKVVLKWNQVEKHIDDMIKNNRFFYDSDFDELQNIYKRDISYLVESFFNDLPDEYAKPYPKETETYNISYVVRDKLDNPQELDNIEKMMSDAMALMGEDYNGYKYRKQEYDDFVAFKNGTYAPYRVPEKAEQKPPHTFTSKFSKAAENKTVLPEWLTEYREIKAENPQAIVFYQQGDFYKAFEQDAVKFANELDLVLTSRHINENTGKRIAMCGFPKHSLDKYMKYLADKGYKIAVSSLGNDERKTIWYAPDYSEDENEKEEQNISIEPTFQAPPKANAYTFDLHPEIPIADRHNYNFAEKEIETVGKKERFRRNMEAIRVLKECEFDNRFATPEEQEILSGYVGWGGISEAFDENNDAWADEFQELYTALSPTEYEAARRSTLTAFYTPQPVISAIYKALDKLGFKQGNILEPCCAIGNFIGMLPQNMQDSKIYGVEIDNISAGIAQQLYQKSSIMTAPFEKAELPESFFDAVVGNVPFGDFSLADKKYDKYHFLIHDYFFAKSLDKLRPGGVMCLVTSKGTMDKESSDVRRYIAQRAELLGAIRLPDNTFKGNAGTEVTSDILILQKRDRVVDIEPDWLFLDEDANGIRMNKYFVEHPDMVLGEMVMQSGRFKPESACKAYEDRTLEEQLNIAVQNINGEITEYTIEDVEENEVNYIPADPNVRNYSYTVVDGTIYYRENSVMREVETSETGKNRIKGMIEIRDCVKNLLEMQTNDYPDYDIEKEQHRLNEIYDKFVKKYGYINSRGNSTAFSDDSSYFLICSLEVFKNDEFERKADIFTKRTIQPHIAKTHADTSIEAYGISIGEKAKIDMPFMYQLTGKSEEEIFADLNGVIFLNPDYDENNKGVPKYLPADEYLSGNVRRKLRQAREIAENDDRFAVNVDALEKVQPVDLKATEIEVHLGVTWLPIEIINKFMYETFNTSYYARGTIKVHYNELANVWNIEHKAADNTNLTVTQKYGTSRKNAFHILEATLNLRNVRVFDYEEDENGKRVAILNKKETAIAQSKQELIKQAFKDWIWKDPERREYLCKLYNEKFNSIRPREYDGSHIVFEGMNPEITLRKHQQDAVARGLYGGNTLLAHCVGAGKTYTMAATAMESKRLGLCSKSLFVVPNHLVSQWASEFLTLYPSAKILATTKKDFETKNRKKFCGRIATGDYDAIIIGHSQFEKIPVSIGRQMFTLQKQIDEIIEGISELKASNGERFSVKQLEATKTRLETKLKKLNNQSDKDDVVTFEELGVDRLFVDEAHYYKNLFVYSKMRNVGGISQVEANKSSDMFMKCQYLDELTDSKGITFATGTPISNSMVELYTMQRYLQYDLLREYGYVNFDSWAAQYGETVTTIGLTPEGTGYRSKVRFARFNNLPELMSMFKECADIQTSDMLKLPVPNVEHHNISVKPSEFQVEMVEQLGERAEKIRAGDVKPYVDNMLNITNDGRKLALDQRLINPTLPDFEGSKVNECVRNVYNIWAENSDKKSTQLVFCDLSTPTTKGSVEVTDAEVTDNEDIPETFKNIYVDIRNKLIAKGVPAEEIAFIHEANNDKQKADLFAKVRAGKVRVLLGSTQKMGAGTNVQDKIIASHDIDCPWRPSDLEQRAGRTVRQGNENDTVHLYRYVTENTFDAYLYQLVETKQKFVGQVMTSKTPVRSIEDVDEAALSYAEIKMLATGNPHIKEKMDLDMQVQNLKMLQSNYYSERFDLEDKVTREYPQDIARYNSQIKALKVDIETANKTLKASADYFNGMDINGVHYTEKKAAGEAIIRIMKSFKNSSETLPVGSYRGFTMEMYISRGFRLDYILAIRGAMTHTINLGTDALGNITRVDNCIDHLAGDLEKAEKNLVETEKQLEIAKESLKEPFSREEELQEKQARLNELNALLNVDKRDNEFCDEEPDESEIKQPKHKREMAMCR
nr:DEAD/DEAH box helicase family protein [uncultured Eubacterium sp.]